MKKFISIESAKSYGILYTLFAAIFFSTIFSLSASQLPAVLLKQPGVSKLVAPVGKAQTNIDKGYSFFQTQFIRP